METPRTTFEQLTAEHELGQVRKGASWKRFFPLGEIASVNILKKEDLSFERRNKCSKKPNSGAVLNGPGVLGLAKFFRSNSKEGGKELQEEGRGDDEVERGWERCHGSGWESGPDREGEQMRENLRKG